VPERGFGRTGMLTGVLGYHKGHLLWWSDTPPPVPVIVARKEGDVSKCKVEPVPRPAHRVAGVTVGPAPWAGLWLATWEQDTADAAAWCTCPWELWRFGAHVCNASKRLLDTWQAAHLPVRRLYSK